MFVITALNSDEARRAQLGRSMAPSLKGEQACGCLTRAQRKRATMGLKSASSYPHAEEGSNKSSRQKQRLC